MILAGILVGCNGVPKYDSRLVCADSLLKLSGLSNRQAGLNMIQDIHADSLISSGDRAYYSLLLTQASYLNYIKATPFTDSLIDNAIDYYEKHNKEYELLTRAYIYKGTVLEDLGSPDTAMTFYKQAEANANASGDNFNQGYALLRMGKLYYRHHAYDGRDIEKLEQALSYFQQVKDTTYQIICLKDLGALYRSSSPDTAENKLNEAIKLAEEKNDTDNLIHGLNSLAYLYFMKGQKNKSYNKKAFNLLQRIKSLGLYGLEDNVYTTFACVYANLGMPDSALWYLNLAQSGHEKKDSAYFHTNNYLEPMSLIAKAKGELIKYYKLSLESDSITFSSLNDSDIVNIMYAELKFDEQHKNKMEEERRTRNYIYWGVVGAVILSLLLFALLFYRRSHRYDKLVLELKDQSQSQMKDLTDMQHSVSELQINDERLKGFIASHMGMMRDIIEACYHEPNNRIAENMKRIVKFQDSNKENWVKLYDYIDLEHNNIMTRTRENFPELNDKDLLLLALTCMGYSYIHIAIIMGYSNATSVSVLKQRLAKKMGIECSLNEYIQNNGNV